LRRVLRLALMVWLLRWAAGELAAYAGRHWLPPQKTPKNTGPRPGWMLAPRTGDGETTAPPPKEGA
jgi:hypothetical protein